MAHRSRRFLGVVALTALGLTACGTRGPADAGPAPSRPEPTEVIPGDIPADTTATSTADPPAPGTTTGAAAPVPSTTRVAGPEATTDFVVYLLRGEKLEKVVRRVPKVPGIGQEAMKSLLRGPSRAEAGAGLGTAVPAGTALLGLTVERGTATVDLSRVFESGGGTLSMTLRLAQVTCTLDQFESITGVRFALAGKPISVFSGEGIVLDKPVTCSSYAA